MTPRPVRIVSEVARRIAEMIDREIQEQLGPNATFEQQQDAAAAIASDALWVRADDNLHKAITTAEEVEVDGSRYQEHDAGYGAYRRRTGRGGR
jgi:hypothetical protein